MRSPLSGQVQGKKQLTESDLINVRHDLMHVYGWISIEQFKKISIPELWDLYELVQKEKKIMYTAYQSMMSFAGMKPGQIKGVFR